MAAGGVVGVAGVAEALPLGHVEVGADQPAFCGGSAGCVVDVDVPEPEPDPFPEPEPDPVPEPVPDAVLAGVLRVRGGVVGFAVAGVAGAEGEFAPNPLPWAGVVAAGGSEITFSVPVPAGV